MSTGSPGKEMQSSCEKETSVKEESNLHRDDCRRDSTELSEVVLRKRSENHTQPNLPSPTLNAPPTTSSIHHMSLNISPTEDNDKNNKVKVHDKTMDMATKINIKSYKLF